MGNSGSQTGHINHISEEPQWNYSFPRPQTHPHPLPHQQPQLKVLPDRDARQKLRPTNNGEILQSGGTLTGRQHQIKRCDSAPDLRYPQISAEHKDAIRTKKQKYKAPSPPKHHMRSKQQWDDTSLQTNNSRKPRLFKTRLETKKTTNNSSPVNRPVHLDKPFEHEPAKDNQQDNHKSRRLSLHDMSFQTPLDFQEELKLATSNLKFVNMSSNSPTKQDKIDHKEKLKTLDHNINNVKKFKRSLNEEERKTKTQSPPQSAQQPKYKESPSPEQEIKPEKRQEPKTFYFGMDDPIPYRMDDSNLNYDFNINQDLTSSFESDLSSWPETDSQPAKAGIDLKLRPILPKKPLEIPRFSPAAAWRLLSSMNSSDRTGSTLASDECSILVEDRIEKFARPPPPALQIARFSNDKSGDSGISGDAGPTGYEDTVDTTMNSNSQKLQMSNNFNPTHRTSWTPQQDLEDDSSMEEYLNNESDNYKQPSPPVEITTKPHVFSLSLPRDNQLASYMLDKAPVTGLKKLKRSVSGVLGNLSNRKDFTQPNLSQEQNDNWLLSKSQANSLTNGFNSLEMRYSQKSDQSENKNLVPNSAKQNGVRVMYLPEFDKANRQSRTSSKCGSRYGRSRSMDRIQSSNKLSLYSKSCENISAEVQSSSEPEDLQDPIVDDKRYDPSRKGKKFTFQSTIRQIERKIIAEKLSREAERKEKQRLREVEAMRKVEEEFQKKRAREKAAIRQQLRMYNGSEAQWSSLPANIELSKKIPTRTEPDGAASSPANSSPPLPVKVPTDRQSKVFQKNRRKIDLYSKSKIATAAASAANHQQKIKTQVLSEYKQPQRDYKEYRSPPHDNHYKHPPVQYNMPKTKGKTLDHKPSRNVLI